MCGPADYFPPHVKGFSGCDNDDNYLCEEVGYDACNAHCYWEISKMLQMPTGICVLLKYVNISKISDNTKRKMGGQTLWS